VSAIGGPTAPVAARPGQTYFVPGVRILRLPPMPKAGPEKGEEIYELRQDILSVTVMRPCTGSAQYCIEINNWFDQLPRDRPPSPADRQPYNREPINGATGQPVWPRFKYTDFTVLDFGMRLRIDMRYFPDNDKTLTPADLKSHDWVPMISGPISDMQFTFTDDGGARLRVCGEDDLCILKNKNPKKHDYWGLPEKEIVLDVLERAKFPLPLAPPPKAWPKFTESSAKALAEAHFEGQSYLDYLMKFAERWDFELFLEYNSLDDADSGQMLHFEPCRCRTPDNKTFREMYVVERGVNLVEFTPTLRVVDQVTSVTFCGHNHYSGNPEMTCRTSPENPNPMPPLPMRGASPEPLDDELHRDVARGDEPLTSGPEWRRRKFGLNPETKINQRGIDAERAEVMAEAYYRKRACDFLKVDTVTLGLPRLRAGRYVEYRGMRAPFDGFYYVETSTHTYSNEGLRTHFVSRRPGMPYRGGNGGGAIPGS
jgi:hypothetical protein